MQRPLILQPPPSRNHTRYTYVVYTSLLWRRVRSDEHLAEVLEFCRATDLLGKERELYDVEKFIVELVRLFEVLLLHLVSYLTVFAVRVWCFRK